MHEEATHECPSCGLRSALHSGPTHPYMLGSAGCWATFGEVLARNGAGAMHHLATDAYALSHPGTASDGRSVRSVAVHLVLLQLVLEAGVDPERRYALLSRIVRSSAFAWLQPPPLRGRMTAADVVACDGPREHLAAIGEWAEDVWSAWSPHHATVRSWVRHGLGE